LAETLTARLLAKAAKILTGEQPLIEQQCDYCGLALGNGYVWHQRVQLRDAREQARVWREVEIPESRNSHAG
jgi:hypothetical protein